MVIALDGPAGAGKSSVARAVAQTLGFTFLDSGAMYRCVGLLASRGDRRPLAQIAAAAQIELLADDTVRLDGEDVTGAIRTPAVTERSSEVAADPGVRSALVAKQQALLAAGDWVAEGRDIGTVVYPQAELKLFLIATPQERARRRALQTGGDYEAILADQLARDERDSTRTVSPLVRAADALELDTTGMSFGAVVSRIVDLAKERQI